MKTRAMVLSCLIAVLAFSMGTEPPQIELKAEADSPGLKIGVVNVRKIFRDCKRIANYRQELIAERDRVEAELEKLSREIEADRTGLGVLKRGSSDHIALMKDILTKQANSQAQQKLFEQQMALKEQSTIEQLYEDVLQETDRIAQQKGLEMVLVKDQIEFPALSVNDAMMAIRTHKLLYSGGCLDITDEVMARLDEEQSK